MNSTIKKGTVYIGGLFGYQKIEARDIQYDVHEYAQYQDAVFVRFIPKGNRKARIWHSGERAMMVILEGWGHPDPAPIYSPVAGNTNVMTTKISGSPEIDFEFNIFLQNYLIQEQCQLIADYRSYKPKDKYRNQNLNRRIGEVVTSLLIFKENSLL